MNGYDGGVVELIDVSRFRLEPDQAEFEQSLQAEEHELGELAAALELNERDLAEASAFEREQVEATAGLLHTAAEELGLGSESLAHPGLDEALGSIVDADDALRDAGAELPVEAWVPDPGELPAPGDTFLPPGPDDAAPALERPPLPDSEPLSLWGDFTNQAVLLGDWLVAADLPVGEFPVGGSSHLDPRINQLISELGKVTLTQARRRILGAELAQTVVERGRWVLDAQFWYDPNTRQFRPGP